MAGVTPQQVYQALVAAGASTIQAIGIMANMINESSFNPEAVGDQGSSFGLVQQHGGQYSSLVTGNPAADMASQIRVIAQNGGFAAASGATAADAAGNFAANYERCVGCQPGGAQFSSRVANASTVAGWASSGKWPTSAGSATAATSAAGAVGGSSDPSCAWGISGSVPGLSSLPLVGGAFQASVCFVHKTTLRHVGGGLIMFAGGGVLLVGAVILAASAFQRTGALSKTADAAAVVPGGEVVAAGLMAAHARTARSGGSVVTGRQQREQAAQRVRGNETITRRTPISGQMGGTQTHTVRRPVPRP